jgi:hypothetical protein
LVRRQICWPSKSCQAGSGRDADMSTIVVASGKTGVDPVKDDPTRPGDFTGSRNQGEEIADAVADVPRPKKDDARAVPPVRCNNPPGQTAGGNREKLKRRDGGQAAPAGG